MKQKKKQKKKIKPKTTKNNQKQPKTTKNNQKQPNTNNKIKITTIYNSYFYLSIKNEKNTIL